jgi:hypothetical protein
MISMSDKLFKWIGWQKKLHAVIALACDQVEYTYLQKQINYIVEFTIPLHFDKLILITNFFSGPIDQQDFYIWISALDMLGKILQGL